MFISWQEETRFCYETARKRPIKKVQDGGTQYTVSRDLISQAMTEDLDIIVVIIFGMYSWVHMKQC